MGVTWLDPCVTARGFFNFREGVVMLKEKKEQIINELADSLGRCSIAIATDYRGLTAKEITQLRRRLSELDVEYRVVKNTLARFAAEKADREKLHDFLVGPLAIAFSYEDVTKPARVLSEYIRSSSSVLRIKGGLLGDRLLSPAEISILATAPPKDVLLAQLVGQLQAPIQNLHSVLNAPLRGFMNVIQARIQQIEGG